MDIFFVTEEKQLVILHCMNFMPGGADIFMNRLISCTYMLAEYKLSSHIGGLLGWGIFFGKS